MKRMIPFSAVSILLLLTMTLDCFAYLIPISNKELIRKSLDVIHGIVTEVRSDWNEDHSTIYTYVRIDVLQVFKGEPRDEIVIQIPGGSLGNIGSEVEDTPHLREGMEVIIHTFLKEDGYLWINGWERGVYDVSDGVIEQLNMTLDQFRNLVDEVSNQQEEE